MERAKQEPFPFRFNVEQYYELGEKGILAPDAHVELIRGEIIEMFPVGPIHASYGDYLHDRLKYAFCDLARVRQGNPIILSDHSLPEPDIAIVKLNPADLYYRERHPSEKDVHLLIEICDSSYLHNRNVKVPLYAEFGIPEVWLMNLQQKQIEAFRKPENGGYTVAENHTFDSNVVLSPAEFPTISLPVADFDW